MARLPHTLAIALGLLSCADTLLLASAGPALAQAGQPKPMAMPAQTTQGNPSQLFDARRYRPAVLRLSFTTQWQGNKVDNQRGFIDITLIPATGSVIGKRVEVATDAFVADLRKLYAQLSRQDALDVADPASPARQLHRLLIEPIQPELTSAGVTTLLISADPGLQAIPFAALHDGKTYLGERYSFSLTPSLGLMPLDPPVRQASVQQIAMGASRFDQLNPLPLVPQELSKVADATHAQASNVYVNGTFSPKLLLDKASDNSVDRIHVATHAEFLPGGPSQSKLYTGAGALSLSDFASLRQRRQGTPLQLFTLSACRTALGDRDSELGFAGLALQAGSRSAVGSLWYVDDVATSAYYVLLYRYLTAGIPKAEAMQLVRIAMANGRLRLDGDRILGPNGEVVLDHLSSEQKRRIGSGLQHPYFWAGIELLGTPW
jgi:CHAT domain-containing protein